MSVGGFEASTYIEIRPASRRDDARRAIQRGLDEVIVLHKETVIAAEALPGPGSELVEVRLRMSRWDRAINEDLAFQILESAIEVGSQLERAQGRPPLTTESVDIQDSLYVPA